jgi:hypothetical protein
VVLVLLFTGVIPSKDPRIQKIQATCKKRVLEMEPGEEILPVESRAGGRFGQASYEFHTYIDNTVAPLSVKSVATIDD